MAREAGFAGRFGLVGLAATLVHLCFVWTLIRLDLAPPLLANLIAFCVAFGVSFTGHYHWSFQSRMPRRRAAARFGLIALAGFLTGTVVLAGLIRAGVLPPEWAAAIATLVVPAVTFLASRFWGFRGADD